MVSLPIGDSINWAGMLGKTLYWLGYLLISVIILVVFVVIYYVMQYQIKATVFQLYGSGKDGIFSFGKPKKNRVRWIRKKTAWKKLWPIFNKKILEPFDSEYIYPGRQVYAMELNDEWIPCRVNINKEEDEIRGELNPIPYHVRNWQSIAHKENAQEFAEHDFWSENKYFFMVIICAGICCALVGLTVFLTFKYAGGKAESMDALSSAIRNLAARGGAGPG